MNLEKDTSNFDTDGCVTRTTGRVGRHEYQQKVVETAAETSMKTCGVDRKLCRNDTAQPSKRSLSSAASNSHLFDFQFSLNKRDSSSRKRTNKHELQPSTSQVHKQNASHLSKTSYINRFGFRKAIPKSESNKIKTGNNLLEFLTCDYTSKNSLKGIYHRNAGFAPNSVASSVTKKRYFCDRKESSHKAEPRRLAQQKDNLSKNSRNSLSLSKSSHGSSNGRSVISQNKSRIILDSNHRSQNFQSSDENRNSSERYQNNDLHKTATTQNQFNFPCLAAAGNDLASESKTVNNVRALILSSCIDDNNDSVFTNDIKNTFHSSKEEDSIQHSTEVLGNEELPMTEVMSVNLPTEEFKTIEKNLSKENIMVGSDNQEIQDKDEFRKTNLSKELQVITSTESFTDLDGFCKWNDQDKIKNVTKKTNVQDQKYENILNEESDEERSLNSSTCSLMSGENFYKASKSGHDISPKVSSSSFNCDGEVSSTWVTNRSFFLRMTENRRKQHRKEWERKQSQFPYNTVPSALHREKAIQELYSELQKAKSKINLQEKEIMYLHEQLDLMQNECYLAKAEMNRAEAECEKKRLKISVCDLMQRSGEKGHGDDQEGLANILAGKSTGSNNSESLHLDGVANACGDVTVNTVIREHDQGYFSLPQKDGSSKVSSSNELQAFTASYSSLELHPNNLDASSEMTIGCDSVTNMDKISFYHSSVGCQTDFFLSAQTQHRLQTVYQPLKCSKYRSSKISLNEILPSGSSKKKFVWILGKVLVVISICENVHGNSIELLCILNSIKRSWFKK